MDFNSDKYKNQTAYPKRENFYLYRYSIIDSKTFVILANTTAFASEIYQKVGDMVLDFLVKREPNEKNPIVYAEYGPHVWEHPLGDRKKLNNHKLEGSKIRFYRKDRDGKKAKTNSVPEWEYMDDSVFVQIDTIYHEEEYRQAQKDYRQGEHEARNRFKEDLFKDLEIADHPKREKIWDKAWEEGHSTGLHDVYHEAEEIVELIA